MRARLDAALKKEVKSRYFQDYYFISTSSPGNLHNLEGGYCKTHNMKVVFKVPSQAACLC